MSKTKKTKPRLGVAAGQLDLAPSDVDVFARRPLPEEASTRAVPRSPQANDGVRDDETVAAARAWVDARLPHGCVCPVCRQYARRYRRQITSATALALILFNRWDRKHPEEWLHMPSFLSECHLPKNVDAALRGGDYTKLRYWGLIEAKADEVRSDGDRRAGLWRITPLGRRFVRRDVKINRYVLLYAGEMVGKEGALVGIDECLKKRFSYDELMAGG